MYWGLPETANASFEPAALDTQNSEQLNEGQVAQIARILREIDLQTAIKLCLK
jgi:hypothetical protein